MDESFRLSSRIISILIGSFHPCFNGWVFQTSWIEVYPNLSSVSILVLMDESFRRWAPRLGKPIARSVSILVLMDESFRRPDISPGSPRAQCFHPCFNGWVFQTWWTTSFIILMKSFHPCFNGWVFQTFSDSTTTPLYFSFPSLF